MQGVRQGNGVWVASLGEFFDGGAGGVWEAEEFADFVEAFADGVVECGAEEFVVADIFNVHQLAVAAAD